MKPLAIQEIRLINFKNYSESGFHFGDKFNLICGLNGVGKTNLLDALYYLCVGKSYFTAFDHKVVRQGELFFRLEGQIKRGTDQHQLIIKVKPGALKEIILDRSVLPKISEHLGFMPVVLSAPRDSELVYGTSQFRRKYIDHLLCQVDASYLKSLSTYNHLLEMRNAALKQGFNDLKSIIATYDDQIAPLAAYIFEKRTSVAAALVPMMQDLYANLAEKKEHVEVIYESGLQQYPYEVLADMHWEADKNTGRSNAGIHKDDFRLLIKGMSAKDHGSQGQIKSLIFALHLGKYSILQRETGLEPILILDDIFDKLDDRRLHRLVDILMLPEFGQVFISDTSRQRVSTLVQNGNINIIDM